MIASTIYDYLTNLSFYLGPGLEKIVSLSIFSFFNMDTKNLSHDKRSTPFKFTKGVVFFLKCILKLFLIINFLLFLTSRFILSFVIIDDGAIVWTFSYNMAKSTTLKALNPTTVVDRIEVDDEFAGLFLSLGAVNHLVTEVLRAFEYEPPLELLTMPRPALLSVNLPTLATPFALNGPALLILMSYYNCLLALLA
jgi:hypothetical protein